MENKRRKRHQSHFHNRKEAIGLVLDERKNIYELQRKIHSDDKETRILAALELAACCQHLTVKEFTKYLAFWIPRRDMDALKELSPEVKEYLDNHNTTRFGYCPMHNGKPIMEELTTLYLNDIDTYNRVVADARKIFEKEEW